jgi:hypothetical protein
VTFRIAITLLAVPIAGGLGGLLVRPARLCLWHYPRRSQASAIFTLDRIGSLREWRMLFLVEGWANSHFAPSLSQHPRRICTIGVAIIAFLWMPHSYERAKFLTTEEQALGIARIKTENAGTKVQVEQWSRRALKEGLGNTYAWLCGLIFLLVRLRRRLS